MIYGQQRLKNFLLSTDGEGLLTELYRGGAEYQQRRYTKAIEGFAARFGDTQAAVFSAPGRTELSGNHTDHQRGCVLAAAVTLDIAAVASPVETGLIRVFSDSDGRTEEVSLDCLTPRADEKNASAALIRGVAARLKETGRRAGGFNAYITSRIPVGGGLSSSAAFEVLIAAIENHLYNDGKISAIEVAKIGQYAENVYFGKPSGLLDQTASSTGGIVYIDFYESDAPVVEKLETPDWDYDIFIVSTGGSHADLTSEYADIPKEMREVAGYFGREVLREVERASFTAHLGALRKAVPDRAVLRAMHFFSENERVIRQAAALREKRWEDYIEAMIESGRSSFMLLQNIYPVNSITERGNALALAVSEELLRGKGAWRIHGGGFAGTVQALVRRDYAETYKEKVEGLFGEGSVSRLVIRPCGAYALNL